MDKLKRGDKVAIISPSFSYKKIPKEVASLATKRLASLGLTVIFGKHLDEMDEFESSSIESRLDDFHWAFSDPDIGGIIMAVGGYNSNFLLEKIDWGLIKRNPKFFCGMSDITVLSNAILTKTGLVTYSGPNFRNFGQLKYFDYTLEYFVKAAFGRDPIEILSSESWSDDVWWKDQTKRKQIENPGWLVIKEGEFMGKIIGGNLCSLNLLQGTEFMPSITDAVLFIEDDAVSTAGEYSRNLQSLMQLPDFKNVRGLMLGRFQKKTKMKQRMLIGLINELLSDCEIPVVANLDFGHTDPKITFPIGGWVSGIVKKGASRIIIEE